MKTLMEWIKANPLTVASILVAVVSLGIIGYFTSQGRAFRSEVQARAESESREIQRFMRETVQIPPERPDDDSDDITGVTITQGAIRQLERLYGRIDEEYREVFDAAVEFNRGYHRRLVDALFRDDAGPNVPYEARSAYRRAFERMMGSPSGDESDPRLGAGSPPRADQIQRYLEQLEEQIRATYRPPGERQSELSDRERRELERELRESHLALLRERAEQINIYAVTRLNDSEFPFHVGEWSRASDRPEPSHLWEGQVGLWLQQDIARAIARANRVDDPNSNVLNAPVKRLLRVEVIPGYVGLHTLGGVAGSGNVNRARDGSYPIPSRMTRASDGNGALPVNFRVGPTGRVSNAMYDVRHVRVRAIVDDQQLPDLFNALGAVNFMTVLHTTIRDVDEYEALREGFVYGSGNVVEAEMIIEAILLREWTKQMMPQPVRQYLGIDEAERDDTDRFQDDYMYY
ncbi:hypothetical protein ACERK3_00860 [Phycisphaerales bacterium AB-hyl4]|uniref:Uncharacterized protein n=1 Tax=Natronomicrosphaera hydrolytica TaxID=3242702 RepID=A0ABV4U232_9BACT